jgi:hypothetical protein
MAHVVLRFNRSMLGVSFKGVGSRVLYEQSKEGQPLRQCLLLQQQAHTSSAPAGAAHEQLRFRVKMQRQADMVCS